MGLVYIFTCQSMFSSHIMLNFFFNFESFLYLVGLNIQLPVVLCFLGRNLTLLN